MTSKRPTHTWQLTVGTPDGLLKPEKFRSQDACCRRITEIREQVATGVNRATRPRVEQWDQGAARWQLFEQAPVRLEGV